MMNRWQPGRLLCLIPVLLASPLLVEAQVVQGVVRDADADELVRNATVRLILVENGDTVAADITGDDGRFVLRAPSEGEYALDVHHTAYRSVQSLEMRIGPNEAVDVEILVSRQVFVLDPIVVTARREDLLHKMSRAAAVHRRLTLPRHGRRRVVVRGDSELNGAMRVSDVLDWFPHRDNRCMVLHYNGIPQSRDMAEYWLDTSANLMMAVEWYQTWADAPRDLRRWPPGIRDPWNCSVMALWPR